MSKKLEEMLTEFMLVEIGSKAMDGITYTLLTKTPKDKDDVKRYNEIQKEVANCGFTNNTTFRTYELCNGYIFDMDLDMARKITTRIARGLAKSDPSIRDYVNLLGDLPQKRRTKDLINLSKYVIQQYEEGREQIEVALFSRNATGKINIVGNIFS